MGQKLDAAKILCAKYEYSYFIFQAKKLEIKY